MGFRHSLNLLLLLPGTVWGISFIVVELILPYMGPISLTFLRTCVSSVILYAMLRALGSYLPREKRLWGHYFGLALSNQALPFALSSWGQLHITGSLATILLAVMPLCTVLLAATFTQDEKLNPMKVAGITAGLIGTCILVGPSALEGMSLNIIAQLAVIGSALSYAVGAIYTRYIYRIETKALAPWPLRTRIMATQFICAMLLLFPFSLFERVWTIRAPWQAWGYIIFLGIGVTLLATMVYFYLIEHLGAGIASTTVYLIPVAGVIAGALVLGERIDLRSFIALLIILMGVFLVNLGKRKLLTSAP